MFYEWCFNLVLDSLLKQKKSKRIELTLTSSVSRALSYLSQFKLHFFHQMNSFSRKCLSWSSTSLTAYRCIISEKVKGQDISGILNSHIAWQWSWWGSSLGIWKNFWPPGGDVFTQTHNGKNVQPNNALTTHSLLSTILKSCLGNGWIHIGGLTCSVYW